MRAVSLKTARRDRRYKKERAEFLERRLFCEAGLPGCGRHAVEVHHMAGRAPSVFFRQDLWKALCTPCHVRVTNFPQEARERGLSVHSSSSYPETAA